MPLDKDWRDLPDTTTPLTAASMEDLEARARAEIDADVATHSADTTAVHGIADTATLVLTSDARLSDQRVPTNDSVTAAKINSAIKGGPAAGVEALRALGTTATTAAAGNDSRLSDSRAPSGTAGGVLGGTYPNPSFAADMATQAELDAHSADTTAVHGITDTSAVVLTDDSRLTNSRAPSGAAGGVLGGTYPNPSFAADMATQAELDAHTADTTAVHGIADTSAVVLEGEPIVVTPADPSATPTVTAIAVDGGDEAHPRFVVRNDGKILLGDGAAAPAVSLAWEDREGTPYLKSEEAIHIDNASGFAVVEDGVDVGVYVETTNVSVWPADNTTPTHLAVKVQQWDDAEARWGVRDDGTMVSGDGTAVPTAITSATSPMPGLAAPCDPRLVSAFINIGAQPWAMGSRVVVPKSGTLRDVSILIGVASGNIRLAIYDTGDASAGNRTRLWDSGSIAASGANAWQVVADPALAVTAGQQIDFALLADNGTVTAGKLPTVAANAVAQLPTSFWPVAGAAPPKLNWTANMGGFTFPTSFAEAAATPHQYTFFVMGRVA